MSKVIISNVAIYLRKSRGDNDDDVLRKHRKRLTDYAQSKGWNYKIYEEGVLSGERVSERPVMQKLLKDVENNLYDGVLVVHYDRLSRGFVQEFGAIIESFQFSKTLIITPDKIYDVNNNADLTMLGIQGVFSNTELRTISQRLIEGKRGGAKEGRLTNGNPPYPYYKKRLIETDEIGRTRISFEILVDPEKEKVYNYIKESYLSRKHGTQAIAFDLNRKGIKSPGGKTWSSNAVQRLLLHEFHMGIVIYGKYEWIKNRNNNKRRVQKREREEWSVGRGNWKILKTENEHQEIQQITQKNTKVPRKSRMGIFPTSGLLYCAKCGYRMTYSEGRVEAKTGKKYDYTKCMHRYPDGTKCTQKGIKLTDEFYQTLYQEILNQLMDVRIIENIKKNEAETKTLFSDIDYLKDKLKKESGKLERIKEAFHEGIYDLKEFGKEKKKVDQNIKNFQSQITTLENEIDKIPTYSKKDLEKQIAYFEKTWKESKTAKEQNVLLKSVINKIMYDREEDNVTFEIRYI